MAERHAGTRRTRVIRVPPASRANSRTASASSGITTHSHDGDRIENPPNTGWTTHGDFRAPDVTAAGTTGDRPAATTRITSGSRAAVARQPSERITIAVRPSQP